MMKQIAVISLMVFAVVMLVMYVFQRHLIYFPNKRMPVPQNFQASDMEVVFVATQDGLLLHSWYKPAINNQPTVLFFHGNAGHIGYRMPLVRQLINADLGVFLLEYRGYGGNKGQPNEQGLYEDGRAAMRFLQQQGVRPEKIALFGESLGTGVATQIAVDYPVCALVLQSPFTSLVDLARYHYPWLPMTPWDRFNSLERMQTINAPVLILHGSHDKVVPYVQGLAIFKQAQQPKKMLTFDGRNHNDLWDDVFFNKVIAFIQKQCS